MTWNKEDYAVRVRAYLSAFQSVAKTLSPDDPVLKLMGSLAWGRHDAEFGPDDNTLRSNAVAYGFLYGCERMLVKWCNQNGRHDVVTLLIDAVRKFLNEAG